MDKEQSQHELGHLASAFHSENEEKVQRDETAFQDPGQILWGQHVAQASSSTGNQARFLLLWHESHSMYPWHPMGLPYRGGS